MSLPTEVEVLVVGAGPVGLAAAITLSQLDRQVAIVDSSTTTRNNSRAGIVHSRTLEVLNTIGLAEPILERGIRCAGALFYGSTNKLAEVDFSVLEGVTPFPNSILIPQHDIENIFRNKLKQQGVSVHTNSTVVDIHNAKKGLEVIFADGSIIHAIYVVGADGARSIVRKIANISFRDPDTNVSYDNRSVPPSFHIALADVRIKKPIPPSLSRNRICAHLDTFFFLIPLPSDDDVPDPLWRIGFGTPAGGPEIHRYPPLEYLQQQMDKRNPWDTRMEISEVIASSRYRVRSALAETYYHPIGTGNILLAGDAAHVHSPVGGQGMNLGICDAVAAAHAISAHVKAVKANGDDNGSERVAAADEILQRYSNSRHAIGKKVVGMTKGMTAMINLRSGWKTVVRNLLLRLFGSLPFFRRAIVWRMSGLGNRE
ncbi:hypothetical protein BU17DRAFT_56061 [Hysterangium stoloniferum]|nr:hypothetical protein BU17DRAFT_56061 [Hysterangium stoloniferum]